MKKAIIITLLLVPIIAFGQSNYYKIINDSKIFTQQDFNLHFKSLINDLPKDYSLTPIIYHKFEINDSIINYVTFQKIWWGDKKVDPRKFDIVYKQDSLFLFLNKKLPEFKLKDLNGKIYTSSKLIGKPTLIDFWAINCRGCILEMPELNKLKEKYNGKVNFIAIAFESLDSVEEFLKKKPFTFYHLVDGWSYASKTLKISGIPVNMFLDKNGFVREVKNVMPLRNDRVSGSSIETQELSNLEFDKILEKLVNQ